jgi:alkanesulfonate monooxygenase SsuD/methylene tetrahydromethanopterin reductase-like flavin-dependent oxidoreductase (luciferase family)
LDNLVHPDSGIGALSISLGVDARGFDLDAPLPEIPETNQSQSGRQRVLERARRENLTVRQLAVALGGYGGLSFTGSAKTIADEMQAWLEAEACDGFNIMFPTIPGGVEDFVRLVVPELQRRGIFRREYAGTTLRDHLGLPRPRNQFF